MNIITRDLIATTRRLQAETGGPVRLSVIQLNMTRFVSKSLFHEALREVATSPKAILRGLAAQRTITSDDRDMEIVLGGTARHTLFMAE